MIIPKSIKIGGLRWRIEDNQDIVNEQNCHGTTHASTQKIFLDPRATDPLKTQTFLHEILHAVCWETGLWEQLRNGKVLTEEELVAAMTPMLYQVLKDNHLDFS